MTRTEIRQLLISELKTGPEPLPSSDDLDFAVDHIARSAEQEAAGRTGSSRTLRVLAGELTDLARTLLGGLKNDVSDPSGREPYYLSADSPVRLQVACQQNRAVWMSGHYFAPTAAVRARLLLYPGSLPFP
jgi:hypothetical protein